MIDEKVLKKHHKDAFRWSLTLCNGDYPLAEDVLQDVYLKILEKKAVFKGKAVFKTWLFTVIRNTVKNKFRHRSHTIESTIDERFEITFEEEKDTTDSNQIGGLLKQLSLMQRSVLQLVFYESYTIEEAAEILEVSVGTARTHYKRGKMRLKQMMENLTNDNKFKES